MTVRPTVPGDALAIEARPLLKPQTRPDRVEDERSAAAVAPWPLVPGDDPRYPVYTPNMPESPVHAETRRKFVGDLVFHLREAFRDVPHTLASNINLYYKAEKHPQGRFPGNRPIPVVPDLMLFTRTIAPSRYRSYRTWEVGAPA